MVTAVLSVVAVREPDPVEYVDIECRLPSLWTVTMYRWCR